MKKLLMAVFLAPAIALAGPLSGTAAPLITTLQMEASAKSQVANDEMVVTLAMDRTGTSVGPLNDAVLGALNSAIADAKRVPGINARLGSVATNQNWENGKVTGWRVSGSVILDSMDLKALSILTGKLSQSMQLSGIQFKLSDKSRMAEEKRLLAEAASNFKEKAGAATKAFGFTSYTLKDLAISQSGILPPPRPVMMMSMAAKSAPVVPADGGDSEVSVSVSGSIVLN